MSRRRWLPRRTRIKQANSHPAHDITATIGQPDKARKEPLSSNTVAAMAAPRTPSRMTRPRTYMPVPPITRVASTWTVKSKRTGTR